MLSTIFLLYLAKLHTFFAQLTIVFEKNNSISIK